VPSPVAHGIAGGCIALLAARRLPAAGSLPVAAALLIAANLPDLDLLALAAGRAAMERLHQGPLHSLGFVAAATAALALTLRRRLGLPQAWLLLAGAGLTHLLLDLLVADRKPPIGFPFFWPLSSALFHAPVEIFPGVDRADVFSARNLRELLVELGWGLPALLIAARWPRPRQRSHP